VVHRIHFLDIWCPLRSDVTFRNMNHSESVLFSLLWRNRGWQAGWPESGIHALSGIWSWGWGSKVTSPVVRRIATNKTQPCNVDCLLLCCQWHFSANYGSRETWKPLCCKKFSFTISHNKLVLLLVLWYLSLIFFITCMFTALTSTCLFFIFNVITAYLSRFYWVTFHVFTALTSTCLLHHLPRVYSLSSTWLLH
jgi:hypothetical protein